MPDGQRNTVMRFGKAYDEVRGVTGYLLLSNGSLQGSFCFYFKSNQLTVSHRQLVLRIQMTTTLQFALRISLGNNQ